MPQANSEDASVMAELTRPALEATTGITPTTRRTARRFDAFISYSHRSDRDLARSLEKSLWKFGRPWYGVRGTRTYRDEVNLAAEPNLWPKIEEAIKQSHCLLLLASPGSAKSDWVPREVAAAIKGNGADSVCIVLTDGVLPWTDDVPPEVALDQPNSAISKEVWELISGDTVEPLVIDLRPYRSLAESERQKHQEYLSLIAAIAAKALGKNKDEIWGQRRRAERLRLLFLSVVAIALLGLAAALGLALDSANRERDAAIEELVNSTLEVGTSSLRTDPARALQIALATHDLTDSYRPLRLLRSAIRRNPVWTTLTPDGWKRSRPGLTPQFANPTDPFRPNLDLTAVLMSSAVVLDEKGEQRERKLALRSIPTGQVLQTLTLRPNEVLWSDTTGGSEFAIIRMGSEKAWTARVFPLTAGGLLTPIWEGADVLDIASAKGRWPLFVLHADGALERLSLDRQGGLLRAPVHKWVEARRVEVHPSGKSLVLISETQALALDLSPAGSTVATSPIAWPFAWDRYANAGTQDCTKISWGPGPHDLYVLEQKRGERGQSISLSAFDLGTAGHVLLKQYEAKISRKDMVNQLFAGRSLSADRSLVDFSKFGISVGAHGERVAMVVPDSRLGTQVEVFDVRWLRTQKGLALRLDEHQASKLAWRSPPEQTLTITALALSPTEEFVAVGSFYKDEDLKGTGLDGVGVMEHWSIAALTDKRAAPDFTNLIADPISTDIQEYRGGSVGMAPITQVAYSSDGSKLAMFHADSVVRVFHVPNESGTWLPKGWEARLQSPTIRSYGPFGRYVDVRFGSGERRLYDLRDGHQVDLKGADGPFKPLDILWVAKKRQLLIASEMGVYALEGSRLRPHAMFTRPAQKVRLGEHLTYALSEPEHVEFFVTDDGRPLGGPNTESNLPSLIRALSESASRNNQSRQSMIEWRPEGNSFYAFLEVDSEILPVSVSPNASNGVDVRLSKSVYTWPKASWNTVRVGGGILWLNSGNYGREASTTVQQVDPTTGIEVVKFQPPTSGWPAIVWEIEAAFEMGNRLTVIFRHSPRSEAGQLGNFFVAGTWNIKGGPCLSWTSLGVQGKNYGKDLTIEVGEREGAYARLPSSRLEAIDDTLAEDVVTELDIVRLIDGKVLGSTRAQGHQGLHPMLQEDGDSDHWQSVNAPFYTRLHRDLFVGGIHSWSDVTTTKLAPSLLSRLEDARRIRANR